MAFMNEYDIESALLAFDDPSTERLFRLALVVNNLADWANENSDGWHSWPKPARAARTAMGYLEITRDAWRRGGFITDITEAEFKRAITPIKAFLTRQKVSDFDRESVLAPLTGTLWKRTEVVR